MAAWQAWACICMYGWFFSDAGRFETVGGTRELLLNTIASAFALCAVPIGWAAITRCVVASITAPNSVRIRNVLRNDIALRHVSNSL
eukprot:SAG11_NODE_524_length_8751_cov_4.292765_11_plen_87_part_00